MISTSQSLFLTNILSSFFHICREKGNTTLNEAFPAHGKKNLKTNLNLSGIELPEKLNQPYF